jgi:hypothetical protein
VPCSCARSRNALQVRVPDVRVLQLRADEECVLQLRVDEERALQVRVAEVRVLQLNAVEERVLQLRVAEVRVLDLRLVQVKDSRRFTQPLLPPSEEGKRGLHPGHGMRGRTGCRPMTSRSGKHLSLAARRPPRCGRVGRHVERCGA